MSYSLIFVGADSELIWEKHYCGKEPSKDFLNTLLEIEEKLLEKSCFYKDIKSMIPLTDHQQSEFDAATQCRMCHVFLILKD